MKQPTTVEEVKILHDMRRSDPRNYLKIVDGWLAEDPNNREAYFDRHFAWMNLGEPLKAMEDMNKVLAFGPEPLACFSRAEVQKYLGNYEMALEDFGRSEAIIPDEWVDLGFGLLQQADCHARLGDEYEALKCCARLPDDFWTPGMNGAPGGDREAIAEKLRMVAAEARRSRT